ncbi:MAG TPA: hypothetical protein VLA80_11600 [Actinomycetota bacterium]|nr:hypothetical protein [Actinomycetota bacterium]
MTPDGHVWYLRRRRARRRPFWSRGRHPERFHGEEELPAEEPRIPPWSALWRAPNRELGERGFDRFNDERHAAVNAQLATVIGVLVFGVLVFGVLVAGTVRYVLPSLRPFLAANARPLLGLVAVVTVVAALNQVHRPWYVELQRQGLADAPRRVWRVQGRRRSTRLMGELTAAIREGRIDSRGAVILPSDGRR